VKLKPLLAYTSRGLYCAIADVYIDPHKPVSKAIITHGHSDHATPGHRYYLCTPMTGAIIKFRLGGFIQTQILPFGETLSINQVQFSFHPAGHIPGSAQVKVEYKGEVWVVTGDYKTEIDPVSGTYESIPCHTLITETTFALPIYQWRPQEFIFRDILAWHAKNKSEGKTTVLLAYALGKSQRLIASIPPEIPVYTHGSIESTNEVLRSSGLPLRPTIKVSSKISKKEIQKGITIAPGSVLNSPWIRSLQQPVTANISGWMTLRGNIKRQTADQGFALSDHVDWTALNQVVESSGAEHIGLTHGYTVEYAQWLQSRGKNTFILPETNALNPANLEASLSEED